MIEAKGYNSTLLDALRGAAAIFVVAGHSREHAAYIFDLNKIGENVLQNILLIPSSFAMESVAVFFVLSGYLVGGQIISESLTNRFDWRIFLIKRLSRLWTVLIPGIIVTWIVAIFISNFSAVPVKTPFVFDAFCNFAFLQEFYCQSFSLNASLWSLSYEFWFYVFFAFFINLVVALYKFQTYRALFLLSCIVAIVLFLGIKLLMLIPAWAIGAGLSYFLKNRNTQSNNHLIFISILAISALSVLSNLFKLNRETLTLFIAIPTALFLYSANATAEIHRVPRQAIYLLSKVGRFSFSLYVYHLPFVLLYFHFLKYIKLYGISLPALTYSSTLFSLPLAFLLSKVTEEYTSKIRRALFYISTTSEHVNR